METRIASMRWQETVNAFHWKGSKCEWNRKREIWSERARERWQAIWNQVILKIKCSIIAKSHQCRAKSIDIWHQFSHLDIYCIQRYLIPHPHPFLYSTYNCHLSAIIIITIILLLCCFQFTTNITYVYTLWIGSNNTLSARSQFAAYWSWTSNFAKY